MFKMPEPRLEPVEEPQPVCPICGEECEYIFTNLLNDVVGCERCLEQVDAWDWMDSQKGGA